jgi:hypothetical protein
MSEVADKAPGIVKGLLTGSIVNEDGTPVDCSEPHIVVLEGEACAPYLWIIRAWCSKADFDEAPDDPNLELKGSNKERDDDEITEDDYEDGDPDDTAWLE